MRISDWSSDVCSSDLLAYDGGDKLYVPVENIDVLSRYGSESEGVALDRLGGAQWQARKARMKERIRENAGELLKTAEERALRGAPSYEADPRRDNGVVARFPSEETDDTDPASDDVLEELAPGNPSRRP